MVLLPGSRRHFGFLRLYAPERWDQAMSVPGKTYIFSMYWLIRVNILMQRWQIIVGQSEPSLSQEGKPCWFEVGQKVGQSDT